ncbi:hypothetical protein [Streptomyces chartreusis]|uniref:hypothetical protein n=1 Tax=Streptomyces chartreusis TaxID=1969 RepID=UPI0035DC30A8
MVVSTDAAEDAARLWQVYRRRFDVEHVRRFGAFTASRVAIRLSIEQPTVRRISTDLRTGTANRVHGWVILRRFVREHKAGSW